MKKILTLLLGAILSLSLYACSGSADVDTAPQNEEAQTETTEETSKPAETDTDTTETDDEASKDNG